jgi:hypothetical protein
MRQFHTPETIAMVRELAGNKQLAAEIAANMSTAYRKFTRNSIIGLARRNGITLHGRQFEKSECTRKHRRQLGLAMKAQVPRCETVPEEVPEDLKTFAELTSGTCRYPFGTHDYLFCGRPPVENLPYCGAHCRIAFRRNP